MRVEPLGDRCLIVRDLSVPAWEWAERVNGQAVPGIIEAFASYDTVGLEIDPARFQVESILPFDVDQPQAAEPRLHRIPVCYEMGPDLSEVAQQLGLSEAEVVSIHAHGRYRCEAVGFCPGFAYLSGLDRSLQGIPRRPSPRPRVESGSVAITGVQSAVYPLETPGGWALIGRTPLEMVNVADGYFPIRAGDEVAFFSISESDFISLEGDRL